MLKPPRYASVRSIYGPDPSLLACYPLTDHFPGDVSGKGNHATFENLLPGHGRTPSHGGVLTLGASVNRIKSGHTTTLQNFTAGGWFYIDTSIVRSPGTGGYALWNKRENWASSWATFPFGLIASNTGTGILMFLDQGNNYTLDFIIQAFKPLFDRWCFYCSAKQGTSVVLCLDEVFTTGTYTYTISAGKVGVSYQVGAYEETGGGAGKERFAGFLGEHFLFNRGLSISEIANIYRVTQSRYRFYGTPVVAAGGGSPVSAFSDSYQRRRVA